MYTFTGAIWTKVKEGLVQIFQRWNQIGSTQKQPSVGIWKKKNIGDVTKESLWKNNQGRPPKLSVWQKGNIVR